MIEVTFTESAGGGLSCAMTLGKDKYHTPAFAIIGENEDGTPFSQEQISAECVKMEEDYQKMWETAIPMEGDPIHDLYCLSLGLSMGDISDDLTDHSRIALFNEMYVPVPGETFTDYGETHLKTIRKQIKKLIRRASEGEPVRLWYSDVPDEMCGFYHILSLLPVGSEIWTVKLPEYTEEGNTLATHNGWGDILPNKFADYQKYQEKLSENAHRMYRFRWNQLVAENAPLRAVINGKVVSAGEDLYDFYILRELNTREEVFHEAHLIGDILGKYQLGISDWFIHRRIRHFEDQGLLEAVDQASDSEPGYRRYLRKTTK